MTFIILLAIGAVLVLYFISVQRRLVVLDENTQNAMSQIGVQLTSRWDVLTQLAKATKAYAQHEHDTLMDVIASRRADVSGKSTAKDVETQQMNIEHVMAKINAVAENYPELKADTIYIKTMDSINDYENKVRMSRMVYNDTITIYNRVVKQIPTNIVASVFGYKAKEYLQEVASKTDMPELEF